MPFTYLSHQGPALGLKMLRPRWFDGTALVIGSMAPDFAYALTGTPLAINAHAPIGLVVCCVPVTMGMCFVIRAWVAWYAFAQLPNTPARLHDLRVLACRRPPMWTTAWSALAGAITHTVWDTFTHDDRWGAYHMSFLRDHVATLAGQSFTVARTLQYVSHIGGAIVTCILLWVIADRGLLARWYGDAFRSLPPVRLERAARVRFWLVAAAGTLVGCGWALVGTGNHACDVIRVSLGLALGVVVASLASARADRDVRV